MDTRETYRQAILRILESHRPRLQSPDALQVTLVRDHEQGHYLMICYGWQPAGHYSFGCVLHIDLTEENQVVVRHNGTEDMIGDDLHAAGVAKEDIILAFHEPEVQAASGFGPHAHDVALH